MAETKVCTSCGGELKKGCLYVRNNDHPSFFNFVVWVESEKMDLSKLMGLNASAPQYPVDPYRCTTCGKIEHYASEEEKWRH